jgi:hypothetical protein
LALADAALARATTMTTAAIITRAFIVLHEIVRLAWASDASMFVKSR